MPQNLTPSGKEEVKTPDSAPNGEVLKSAQEALLQALQAQQGPQLWPFLAVR